jgi:RimJ/RimL family protein N-acetyltransferase
VEPWPRLRACRLQSKRLLLEPLRVEHADELAPLLDDVALHTFTGGEPAGVEELRARFERPVTGRSPDGRDDWLNWTVRRRAAGDAIGTVQATVKPARPSVIGELAWVIGTSHQGQGFAKEALGLVADWLREQHVRRLCAHIHPGHEASMAVARSIGLLPTDTRVDGEVEWLSSEPA